MASNIGIVFGFCLSFLAASIAPAQEKRITLAVDAALIDAGLMDYLLPRFSLKTQIRVSIAPMADAASADVWFGAEPPVAATRTRQVMHVEDGPVFSISLGHAEDAGDELAAHARRFADWLTSEVGQRTIGDFERDGAPVYVASAGTKEVTEGIAFAGDAVMGETVALTKCGRCHVINESNRMNGLGSTPSFGALKALSNWQDRFLAFYTANPHPSFTQIDGMTRPFDPMLPSPIHPVVLAPAEYEALLAYVALMPASNLGAPVDSR